MSVPVRMSLHEFLMLRGLLYGEIHVYEGSPRRGRARGANRRKEMESRTSLAGPGDGSGTTDGGSANTSSARSSGRTGAGPAESQGEEPKRALIPGKEQWAPRAEYPASEIQTIKNLSETRWDFVNEINEGVDLTAVSRKLLADEDSKVQLRMLERLLDILDSTDWKDTRVIEQRPGLGGWNLPRPERD